MDDKPPMFCTDKLVCEWNHILVITRLFALIYVNTRRLELVQPYIVYIILNCWNLLLIIHIFLLMDLKIAIQILNKDTEYRY